MSGVGSVLGLHIQPRAEPSARMRVAAPLIAIALTLLFGVVFFAAVGRDPAAFFYAFFVAPLGSANGVSEWLLKASSLTLIGLGLGGRLPCECLEYRRRRTIHCGRHRRSGSGAVHA